MKQNLAEKTDRANNGPVKDRLRRGGLVKKQANNTVSGNIRDDAPATDSNAQITDIISFPLHGVA